MGTKTFAQLVTEVGRLGRWGTSDITSTSYGHASAAAEAGLRRIETVAPWKWLEAAGSITVTTAGDYTYSMESDVFRLRSDSFRYGGIGTELEFRSGARGIDMALGPAWRDASTANGTPKMIARVGNELWIGWKPSAEWITAYGTIYYYYIRHEVLTGALYLPDAFFQFAVHAALAEGLKQKDDRLQGYYDDLFERSNRRDMLACNLVVGASGSMASSRLATEMSDLDSSYDGYY